MADSAQRVREEGVQVPRGAYTINSDLFILDDGVVAWGPAEYTNFPESEEDLEYVIDRIIRPEQIAKDFYGEARLWWVIAVANGIRQPLTGFKPGVRLRIPSPERVQILLESGARL
jgi:nucleoid-associated protein YgaU